MITCSNCEVISREGVYMMGVGCWSAFSCRDGWEGWEAGFRFAWHRLGIGLALTWHWLGISTFLIS